MNKSIAKLGFLLAAFAMSVCLAIGGYTFYDKLGFPTPGVLAAKFLVPESRSPHEFSGVGDQLGMQMLVDALFWFGVMLLLYPLATKRKGSSRNVS